jgi:hypothetical protein
MIFIYITAAVIGIAVFNFLSNDNILLDLLIADFSVVVKHYCNTLTTTLSFEGTGSHNTFELYITE